MAIQSGHTLLTQAIAHNSNATSGRNSGHTHSNQTISITLKLVNTIDDCHMPFNQAILKLFGTLSDYK